MKCHFKRTALTWMCALMCSSSLMAKELEIRGMDISLLPREEQHFNRFVGADGKPRDGGFLEIVKEYGVNTVRIHLWHTPVQDFCDLGYVKELALRAKEQDLKFMLDIMYSDDWCNPGKQDKPRAWKELSERELLKTVYTYSKSVIEELADAGVCPDYIQCGNESTGWIMETRGANEVDSGYYDLMEQAIKGCRAGLPKSKRNNVKIFHHIHGVRTAQWILPYVEKSKIWDEIDGIALSYYLYFRHGEIATLADDLETLADTFDKELLIVETAFPWKETGEEKGEEDHTWEWDEHGGKTREGQKAYLEFMMKTVSEIPHHLGRGVIWYGGTSHGSAKGGVFDEQGNPLPVLEAFRGPKK